MLNKFRVIMMTGKKLISHKPLLILIRLDNIALTPAPLTTITTAITMTRNVISIPIKAISTITTWKPYLPHHHQHISKGTPA